MTRTSDLIRPYHIRSMGMWRSPPTCELHRLRVCFNDRAAYMTPTAWAVVDRSAGRRERVRVVTSRNLKGECEPQLGVPGSTLRDVDPVVLLRWRSLAISVLP